METQSLSMGRSQSWFRTIRKKLFPSSHTTRTILNYSNTNTFLDQEAFFRDETLPSSSPSSSYSSSVKRKELSEEDIAATKIQAIFRAHLVKLDFLLIGFNFIFLLFLFTNAFAYSSEFVMRITAFQILTGKKGI